MKLSKEPSPLSQLSINPTLNYAGREKYHFSCGHMVRTRTLFKVRLFLSMAFLAWLGLTLDLPWLGLTLDLPRQIKSKTPGHMYFWEASA